MGNCFPQFPFFDESYFCDFDEKINTVSAASETTIDEIGLKRWECIQVKHHLNVGRTTEEFESKGWTLHTYSAAHLRGLEINHYLLFERNELTTASTSQRQSP